MTAPLLALALVLGQPPAPATPCDTCVPGVINFAKVDDRLWRGAQPTAEGFRALERMGVRTVISFRHDHDDRPLLAGTHLRYVRLPSRAWHPTEKRLAIFLKLVQDPANGPVFIHCAEGRDRTGCAAAAYRIAVQGWKPADALAEMKAFHFNRIWVNLPGFVRGLKAERLEQLAAEAPEVQPGDAGPDTGG